MGSKNLGPGVSGYLNPDGRAWETTVFQAGKPVLDKELNLQQDVDIGAGQFATRLTMPSGWLSSSFLNTSRMDEGVFVASAVSNELHLRDNYAHVNGWIISVLSTGATSPDATNYLDLGAGPVGAGIKRTDLVILEVWRRLLSPAPSGDGKSGAGRIWGNGNVKITDESLNFVDDIKDAVLGAESTKRVQIQYRLRVIQDVNLFQYPLGIDDPVVLAQSVPPSAVVPDGLPTVSPWPYVNSPTDPGLWVAGDGIPTNELGTVDGYMYAIPFAAVFRRNQNAFDRTLNQNGGVASPGPSDRPDGLFEDILVARDVADLRLGTSPHGWDYAEVLAKNLNFLLDNKLQTEWMNGPFIMGGGMDGHTILACDQIGVSGLNGGLAPDSGENAGGDLIGQFDATRRVFSDRCIYETVVVRVAAPGGGWLTGSVVTIQPTALEIPPYAAFDWAAYNSNEVMFTDVVDAWWVGGVGQVTRRVEDASVVGINTRPIGPLQITIGSVLGLGLTTEDLFVTLVVAYPRGEGLTMTPVNTFAGSVSINDLTKLPAIAPVSYAALAPNNTFDYPHREVKLQYETVPVTTAVFMSNSATPPPPGWPSFMLNERAASITTVLKNGGPLVGAVALGADGRTVTFLVNLDYTNPGDTLQVTYVALRPLPANLEQLSIFYEARAPQTVRASSLGTTIQLRPRLIGQEVYSLAVGSGSQDEGYPYPYGYVQMGGIYPSAVGTFNGDHELSASAQLAVTDFSSNNGLLRLPSFIGYTPAPEDVIFTRLAGDIDPEGRSYFKEVPGTSTPGSAYVPNTFSQELSDAKRHRNFVPMIAELQGSSPVGPSGQLVLVLLLREAFFDALNGISFEPLASNTTTAAVFQLKGRLLKGL